MAATRSISPARYRHITTFALVSLALIILSGAAVRLTGSGLGCSDWPRCHQDQLVADFEYHQLIEFLNRLFSGVVSIAVLAAVLGARRRIPHRRDLMRWSLGLVAGVAAQIVLGGLVVLHHLTPSLVIAHFLLSIVLVWNAVVLRHRASHDGGPGYLVVAGEIRRLGHFLVGGTAVVIGAGTVVTGAGPHAGDETVQRLPVLVTTVARIHGVLAVALLMTALWTGYRLMATAAPAGVRRRHATLVAILIAQGVIGYTQYHTGVPVLLVGLHIIGATALWIAVLWFHLGLFHHRMDPTPTPTQHRPVAAGVR